ncbi:uncharacterized protein LOC107869496 [Capsicum annuum]|uniref:uncharacterized protein LOC107869496 n=1 Tax=Capsicum annuum TaxID=4072 RepID=UPI0007BF1906|nr:uncharacterized protein LOC107869496 [Capsicum annuum]
MKIHSNFSSRSASYSICKCTSSLQVYAIVPKYFDCVNAKPSYIRLDLLSEVHPNILTEPEPRLKFLKSCLGYEKLNGFFCQRPFILRFHFVVFLFIDRSVIIIA